tara:strand:- start:1268 stop:2122 length:855 start_codon:yes stop_codon:yes gene_type:complete
MTYFNKIIFLIFITPLLTQVFNPSTGEQIYDTDKIEKYYSIYIGYGTGKLSRFYAKSAFSSPENPTKPLWTASVYDVSTKSNFPHVGIKFGLKKHIFQGDLELSYFRQSIPNQIVYYDSYGQIYIEPNQEFPDGYYYDLAPQDSVPLPNNFLNFNSFGIGSIFSINIPISKTINPNIGIGLLFLINNVTSEYPGPGNYAAKNVMANFGYNIKDFKSLNTTDFGWGFEIPIGIKYRVKKDLFLSIEVRFSNKYINFIGSDAYLKEEDEATLQSFQYNISFLKIIK